MRKLIFIVFFAVSSIFYGETVQLKSFNEVLDALQKGEHVTAVIHYGKCKLISDGQEAEAPNAVGGMDLLPFEYFTAGLFGNNKGFISVSETILISMPRYGGYVYNYAKLKIIDDNTVEITARYLSVDKLEVKMDETFYGEINDSSNDKAVYFYINK